MSGRVYSAEGPATTDEERPHVCEALGCSALVSPAFVMCARHWRGVPSLVRAEVLKIYQRARDADRRPSAAYLAAFARAVLAVARREGRRGEEVERVEALLRESEARIRSEQDEAAFS